jgi:acyl-CoA synthetase (AMP-forming)/AMP-acid ligase II
MNVVRILDETASRYRDATALVWGPAGSERSASFGSLAIGSRRLAALFRAHGLRAGDAVVIFLPMSGPLYEVMAAVLRLGMSAVFVEPSAWRNTLEQALARMQVRAFVGTPMACVLRWFTPALRRIPRAFVHGHALPGATPLAEAHRFAPVETVQDCDAAATALVTFTSGSTGRPKGVLRSHGMLAATHSILSKHLGLGPGQVHLAVLPFLVFAHLASGATSLIPALDPRNPAAADPESLLRQMRAWGVSGIAASPFLMGRLAQACASKGGPIESLRTAFAGGAAVSPQLLDRIADLAPGATVCALYGATEAEPIALLRRTEYGATEREATRAGGGLLAGLPIEEISLRVLADRWGQPRDDVAELPRGTEGEIAVSGPHISRGYLDPARDADSKIVTEGDVWHRTGDAGYVDKSGRLWLVGRCAAKVADTAGAVYPLRVEGALFDVPGLERATLVKHAGKRVLVLQPGDVALDVDDIVSRVGWCHADEVAQVRSIPTDRRHHAKVDLPTLKAMLERGQWLTRIPLAARKSAP